MTVTVSTSRADATGNGVTTAFTANFRILDQSHIIVYRTQISTGAVTTLAITTDYTVSGVGGTSFTVTCLVAPTTDQRISILRNVPFTQASSYPLNDVFPSTTTEQALDKLTMETQQLSEAQNRALSLAPNSSGVSAALPSAAALKIIGWDATGMALTNYDATSLAGGVATVNWTHDTFSGTGAQVNFTLSSAPGSADNCDVSIGGVAQRSSIDYTLSGTVLTFLSAPPSGTNNIFVRYGTTLPAGVPGDGTVTAAKIADGSVTTVKIADANVTTVKIADANVTLAKLAPEAILRSYLAGLTLSTAGSSATMSIAAGQASDSANATLLSSTAINKTTSAWAVGTGNGGLDTGSIANSTWYYFYLIRRPDTGVVDVVFSTNSSTPTLPTNYTQYRYIGAGLTNGSAQWTKFLQKGDDFTWDTAVLDFATAIPSTNRQTATISVPRGRKIKVLANISVPATSGDAIYISDPDTADLAPSTTVAPLSSLTPSSVASITPAGPVSVYTNTSAQICWRSNNVSGTLYWATLSWTDLRGKDL